MKVKMTSRVLTEAHNVDYRHWVLPLPVDLYETCCLRTVILIQSSRLVLRGAMNPLKTKFICFIQGLSAYRAVKTLHFGYKNQSLNVL
jgi:hypothetical protein